MQIILVLIVLMLGAQSFAGDSSGPLDSTESETRGLSDFWTRWHIDDFHPATPDTFFNLSARRLIAPTSDTSRHVHPGIQYFPDGFPRSSGRVSPWKYWLVTTPFIHTESEENPTIHVSNDIKNRNGWTSQWGPLAADTFSNPVITPERFVFDTLYVYRRGTQETFYDTNGAGAASIHTGRRATHLSDPGMLATPDGGLLLYYRATWTIGAVSMSGIFSQRSKDGVNWESPKQITHLGKWMSPAMVIDTGGLYVMYCTVQEDSVSGITDLSIFYRFTSKSVDSIFAYGGPVTLHNMKSCRPFHMSVWSLAPDRVFAVVLAQCSRGVLLLESRDHGANWIAADKPLVNGGPPGSWYDILYQTSCFPIEEDDRMRLGCIVSAFRDSSGTTIFHTGYTEVNLVDSL
ncbi:MAG: sialidase family protein [candidate division Zixibacteria bacterium]|nr:sialidase family protein [candidate division Zixibacteria bacterium]